MHFFFFSVCCIFTDCSWQLRFDKKQKSCVERIDLAMNNGLYNQKAFYKVNNCFYLLFMYF